MAVSMDEVMFHQHLEEAGRPQTCDNSVQGMPILLIVHNRKPLHKGLNQNGVACEFVEGLWEVDKLVAMEVLVEDVKIVLFDVEVNLFNKSPFERILADWYFVGLGKQGQKSADAEHDVYVSLDVFVHLGMSYFDCDLFAFVDCFVDLAH